MLTILHSMRLNMMRPTSCIGATREAKPVLAYCADVHLLGPLHTLSLLAQTCDSLDLHNICLLTRNALEPSLVDSHASMHPSRIMIVRLLGISSGDWIGNQFLAESLLKTLTVYGGLAPFDPWRQVTRAECRI